MSVLEEAIVQTYLQRAWQTIGRWEELGTAAERGKELLSALNLALDMAHVPPAAHVVIRPLAQPQWASFGSKQWSLSIDQGLLEQPMLARDQAIELLANIYHEARHAQQFWRIQRRLGSDHSRHARAVHQKLQLPKLLVQQSRICPLERGTPQAKEAEFWSRHLDDLAQASSEAAIGFARLGIHSPEENPAAYQLVLDRYFSYPLEADAHQGYHLRLLAAEQGP